MPSYILGAVPDAAMNLVYPLGIYGVFISHLLVYSFTKIMLFYRGSGNSLTSRTRKPRIIFLVRNV